MRAVMLAAGVGARLLATGAAAPPKILLRFAGMTLLERHIQALVRSGVSELVLGVGYHREQIQAEVARLGAEKFVKTVPNVDYEEGSILTLWALREELCRGGPVLLMDADVLYDHRLVARLAQSEHDNCPLVDFSATPDAEAVKLCIRGGRIVEFRKWLSTEFDHCGESVGFFRLSSEAARALVAQTSLYVTQGRRGDPYEEPLRDLFLTSSTKNLAFEDISGLPWIEIDSPSDLEQARRVTLPRILWHESSSTTQYSAAPATLPAL